MSRFTFIPNLMALSVSENKHKICVKWRLFLFSYHNFWFFFKTDATFTFGSDIVTLLRNQTQYMLHYESCRFSLWHQWATSIVAMSDSDGQGREPAGLEGLPPMYSIAKGEVVSVQTYGAFVRLPGYKKEGKKPWSLFMWIIYSTLQQYFLIIFRWRVRKIIKSIAIWTES